MKFDDLRSVAHNLADSMASGIGLMVGLYEMDVYGEAARRPGRSVEVDFLGGTSSGAAVSSELATAIRAYHAALPGICERHGVPVDAFRHLSVRYIASGIEPTFVVTIEDAAGRRASDLYVGIPGRRPTTLDRLGRRRPWRQTG